jgi:hypothetical protein
MVQRYNPFCICQYLKQNKCKKNNERAKSATNVIKKPDHNQQPGKDVSRIWERSRAGFILRSLFVIHTECLILLIQAAGFCFCCKPDLTAKFWRLTGVVFSIGTFGAIDLSSSFPVYFFVHRNRGE